MPTFSDLLYSVGSGPQVNQDSFKQMRSPSLTMLGFLQAAGVSSPPDPFLDLDLGSHILWLGFISSWGPQSGFQHLFTYSSRVLTQCLMRCSRFPAWIIFSTRFCLPSLKFMGCDLFALLTNVIYTTLLSYLLLFSGLGVQTLKAKTNWDSERWHPQGQQSKSRTGHQVYHPTYLPPCLLTLRPGKASCWGPCSARTVGSPVSPNWQFKAAALYTIHGEYRRKMWKSKQLWTPELPNKLQTIMKKVSLEL